MRDLFNRAISLGFGLAAESKEQIEKAVEELVKKGEVSRKESSEMVDELVRKGEEARSKMETVISERVKAVIGEKKWATKEEVALLEKRIEKLEQLLEGRSDLN
ncbi:phasin family protein [Paenibacillus puerhi]|uniref:phasin family protein n=1 Tax=Paenibacillus puerhi TaxID=2692622 RepID=UPI00135B8D22|nr:phasin family protein [Paenibacillus puerhi]